MNRNSIDLIIFLSLVLLTATIALRTGNQTTVDIQLHDTYFVLDKLTFAVLILGPMTILIFLPLAAMRNFKSIGTNIALIFGLMLVAVICYSVGVLSYIDQEAVLDEEGLPYQTQRGMYGAHVILAMVGLATVVLIYRTVKIWKDTLQRPSL